MPLESATYISQLDAANPTGTDPKNQGDDQIRLVKAVLKAQFPAFGAAALASSNIQLDKVVTTFNISSSAPAGSVFVDANGDIGVSAAPTTSRFDVIPRTGQAAIAIKAASGQVANIEVAGNGLTPSSTSFSIAQRANAVAALVNRSNANLILGANGIDHAAITPAGELGVGTLTPGTLGKFAVVAGAFDFFINPGEGGNSVAIGTRGNSPIQFLTNNTRAGGISTAGVMDYQGIEIGWRGLPVATALENGKCWPLSGGVTFNTMAAGGAMFSVYNDTAGALTLTQGAGLTLVLAGTPATTGNRTLSIRGMATVWYRSGSVAIISGPGVS